MILRRMFIAFALLGALVTRSNFAMQQGELIDGKSVLYYVVDASGKNPKLTDAQKNILSSQQWLDSDYNKVVYKDLINNRYKTYNQATNRLNAYTPSAQASSYVSYQGYPNITAQQASGAQPYTVSNSTQQQTWTQNIQPTASAPTQSPTQSRSNSFTAQEAFEQKPDNFYQPTQQSQNFVSETNTQNYANTQPNSYQSNQQRSPFTPVNQQSPTPDTVNIQINPQTKSISEQKELQEQIEIARKLNLELPSIKTNYSSLNTELSTKKSTTEKQQFLWDRKTDIQTYTYNLYKKAFQNAGYDTENKDKIWYAFMEYLLVNGGLPRIEKTMLDRAMLYARKTAAGESLGAFEKLRHVVIPEVQKSAGEGFVTGGLAGAGITAGAGLVSHETGGRLDARQYLPTVATAATIGAGLGAVRGAYQGYQRGRTLNVKAVPKENQESYLNRALKWIGIRGAAKDDF